MKCPKCNSDNTQVQSKEYKPKLTVPIIMVCGGIGLMFFGIGAIVGVIIGVIIAAIVNSVLPQTYHSVMVCQNCGYVSKPLAQTKLRTEQHPLFCDPEDSNLDIFRNDVDKGTIIVIRVKVDEHPHFDIGDNTTAYLNVTEGLHTISYEQINGIGKNKNRGKLNVTVNEKKNILISFTRQGLIVKDN